MAITQSNIYRSTNYTLTKSSPLPHSTIRSTSNRSSFPCLSSSQPPPNNADPEDDFTHETTLPRYQYGSFVYVTLPKNVIEYTRNKTKMKSLRALLRASATAGVEGVVMEVWWGLVEKEPGSYDWESYLMIVDLARECGLKVRADLGFHEVGAAGDAEWIPLPHWVREAMIDDPDLAHADKYGTRNKVYISLACDNLPVLRGRSPIQAYSDFMRSFRDTFKEYLGLTVTGIQVGMGPAGELRYPPMLDWSLGVSDFGTFQCYDKHMLASLSACASEIGMPEWGTGAPRGTGDLMSRPEYTDFFRSNGDWDSPRGRFFLEWYSGMLLKHGESLCIAAEKIFFGTGVSTSGKLAVMHWYYDMESHPPELTAGYYSTSIRDGYLPIARLFGRYGMIMSCNCFGLRGTIEKLFSLGSCPQTLPRQILLAIRASDLPFYAEISAGSLDKETLEEAVKMSKFYSDGLDDLVFSLNLVRLNERFLETSNWVRLCKFVRQISPSGGSIQAQLKFGGTQ